MDKNTEKINDFLIKFNNISQDLYNGNIILFQAVSKLMTLSWMLLYSLVVVWQEELKAIQMSVNTCPYCGMKVYTHKITAPVFIFPFGRIEFYHRRIRCSSCKSYHNLLKQWIPNGIQNRITPLVGEKLVWLAALMPPKEIQFHLQQFWGLSISLTGIKNYVQRMSSQIHMQTNLLTIDLTSLKKNWDRVYIYVDGVMVFINNRWREVKTGIIECHKNGKIYYFYHSEKTKWQYFMRNMKKISSKLGCDSANVKLFISDAGKGITHNLDKYFDEYLYLIDYFHATEHIAKFLKILFRKNKELISVKRKQLTSLLIKGNIKELVNHMHQLRGGKKYKSLFREINYFLNHESDFQYALFRQHKWHIGSGKIESACRWLIQQRFKLSGMRWKTQGFNDILRIRLALYNNSLFSAFRAITEGGNSCNN